MSNSSITDIKVEEKGSMILERHYKDFYQDSF